MWRDVIRSSARQEYEAARLEQVRVVVAFGGGGLMCCSNNMKQTKQKQQQNKTKDPELINRMIVTGRDAVQKAVDRFSDKRRAIIEDEAARQQQGGAGGGGGGGLR